MANRIVEFYSGLAPDHAGRFLADIQQWPDARLEAVHDFIQWLFPLPEPSPVNPLAPVLDPETVEAFGGRPELRQQLHLSFLRMLRFYGLEYTEESRVVPASDFAERSTLWLRPANHNHLRLTRILKSLTLLGLGKEARALFDALDAIYREERASDGPRISEPTFRFWRNAIGA